MKINMERKAKVKLERRVEVKIYKKSEGKGGEEEGEGNTP